MTGAHRQFWLPVKWEAPANIQAFYTTRFAVDEPDRSPCIESSEQPDYSEFNLALHVGDQPDRVNRNRDYLKNSLDLPASPAWLEQTHSTRVIDLDVDATPEQFTRYADGSCTGLPTNVCCVMTADCLPVLLSNRQGRWVAAVHAGWRGLANGIIENAIHQYVGASDDLLAWLGPAISQSKFEIGAEVKQTFITKNSTFESAFQPTSDGKYLADLYKIATNILDGFGIKTFGGTHCTFQQPDKFYSYRRHATTGRMASLIWINNK